MFLAELSILEKKAFLELAHLIANANGDFDEREKALIDEFEKELGIGLEVEDIEGLPLEQVVQVFESETSKRIAFIEGIAVAFADGIYHEEQQTMIKEIRDAFGFSEEYYESVKQWIHQFGELYNKGIELKDGTSLSV